MNIYRFYVYAYLRNDNTPYYIGKGCRRRVYDMRHNVKLPKDKSKIIFYQTGLCEEDAHNLEMKYIKLFGRKDLGTGILRNLTDGGEGTSGFKHTDETKQKITGRPCGATGPQENPYKRSQRGSYIIINPKQKSGPQQNPYKRKPRGPYKKKEQV